MESRAVLEWVVEFLFWTWSLVEAAGGVLKVAESALLLVILLSMLLIGRRIRKQATDFRKSVEGSVNTMGERLNEISGRIDGQLQNTATRIDERVRDLADAMETVGERVQSVTERVQMLRADVAEVEKLQDRAFVTIDQIPPSQTDVSMGLYHWEQVRDAWSDVRNGLQNIVLNLPKKRTQNKYLALDWRNYEEVITRLGADNVLSKQALADALAVKTEFYRLKSRRANTSEKDAVAVRQRADSFLASASVNRDNSDDVFSEAKPPSAARAEVRPTA